MIKLLLILAWISATSTARYKPLMEREVSERKRHQCCPTLPLPKTLVLVLTENKYFTRLKWIYSSHLTNIFLNTRVQVSTSFCTCTTNKTNMYLFFEAIKWYHKACEVTFYNRSLIFRDNLCLQEVHSIINFSFAIFWHSPVAKMTSYSWAKRWLRYTNLLQTGTQKQFDFLVNFTVSFCHNLGIWHFSNFSKSKHLW